VTYWLQVVSAQIGPIFGPYCVNAWCCPHVVDPSKKEETETKCCEGQNAKSTRFIRQRFWLCNVRFRQQKLHRKERSGWSLCCFNLLMDCIQVLIFLMLEQKTALPPVLYRNFSFKLLQYRKPQKIATFCPTYGTFFSPQCCHSDV